MFRKLTKLTQETIKRKARGHVINFGEGASGPYDLALRKSTIINRYSDGKRLS